MKRPSYARCIDSSGYEVSLKEGEVYRVLDRPTVSANTVVILDETYGEPGSDEGYIFDRSRFQFLEERDLQEKKATSVTTHIDELTWLYLRDEAHRQNKTVSTLLREWLEERLDLPVQ
ncbi:MAG: hypothetical protein KDE53_20465 [Caldilineaceae bacterium]|nr:hypothetical protein [Caldilineaceae bacterium]MCB0124652.1 hypothetical protein [Caldilineaceae bacterium]